MAKMMAGTPFLYDDSGNIVGVRQPDGVTAGTVTEGKAIVANSQSNVGAIKATSLSIGVSGSETLLAATVAELNAACDVSAFQQTITASGAVTAGKKIVLLNHATVAIEATIADAANHAGIFHIKAGLEPGAGADHTCTITTGTWNGTHKTATFADINDALVVFFDAAGDGTIISNTGSVSLS